MLASFFFKIQWYEIPDSLYQWWIEIELQLGNKCAITWRISVIIMANVEDNYRYVVLRTFILFQTFLISRRMYADTKFRAIVRKRRIRSTNIYLPSLLPFDQSTRFNNSSHRCLKSPSIFNSLHTHSKLLYPLPLTIIYSPSIRNCSKGESLLSLKSSINGIQ